MTRISFRVCIPAFAAVSILTACDQPPQYGYITGETMGTSYHIRYRQPDNEQINETAIQQAVDARLVSINDSMSTYQDDSIISKFNRLDASQSIEVDEDFAQVYKDAQTVYKLSGGAFDPTVMPLIELWGFGSKMTVDRLQNPPTLAEIQEAKVLIDFESIQLQDSRLTKAKDDVALDFSAIAKGYAVDVIAEVLHDNYQINNYMVEIGGEVATAGVNDKLQPWQIAIDAPVIDSTVSERQVIAVIRQPASLNQLHIATSGNYRNSITYNGKRYSHTIDPLTGSPIVGGAPSVSVAAESVAIADAWATALTAMPYQKAFDMAQDQNIAALFVVKDSTVGEAQETIESGEPMADAAKPKLQTGAWQIVETSAMQALRADTL